jgi:hypothetical protein
MAQVTLTIEISDTAAARVGLDPGAPDSDQKTLLQLAAAMMTLCEVAAVASSPAWEPVQQDTLRRANRCIDRIEEAAVFGKSALATPTGALEVPPGR